MSLEDISGVRVQDLRCFNDDRGSIRRLFDDSYFATEAEEFQVSYTLLSRNPGKGTLRGLHYQEPPYAERKFISCLAGAIFIVIFDLRPGSDSFLMSESMTLTATDQKGIYVPAGLALGWMTLESDTDLHYSIQGTFNASASRGLRFDDPILGLAWPDTPQLISDKDLQWPAFDATEQGSE